MKAAQTRARLKTYRAMIARWETILNHESASNNLREELRLDIRDLESYCNSLSGYINSDDVRDPRAKHVRVSK